MLTTHLKKLLMDLRQKSTPTIEEKEIIKELETLNKIEPITELSEEYKQKSWRMSGAQDRCPVCGK
jgi:hypothetical protein